LSRGTEAAPENKALQKLATTFLGVDAKALEQASAE